MWCIRAKMGIKFLPYDYLAPIHESVNKMKFNEVFDWLCDAWIDIGGIKRRFRFT